MVDLPKTHAYLEQLQPYRPGKPIEELERELGLPSIIKLASNENPLGVSEKVQTFLQGTRDWIYRYPDASGFVLKQALSQKFNLDPACFVLGNGSNELLELIPRAFVATGEEIIFSKYAFVVYPLVTQAIGARGIEVPAMHWGHHLEGMLQHVTDRTKLIFIANPNNPTGTYLAYHHLKTFIENLPSTVVIVVDEAYHEYVSESDYASCIACIETHPNVVVTRTFSKAYGLAGLRIGYSISHPKIAGIINKLRQPFNVNGLALGAARVALEDAIFIKRSYELNLAGKTQLYAAFKNLDLQFIPSSGNFICVDMGQPAMSIYLALLRAGVIVRPLANYDMPNHLRITVGTEEENARVIHALGLQISKIV